MENIEMSLLFAKAYGIYFAVVGLALVVNPNSFRSWYQDLLLENRRVLFCGTLALLIGSFILATHHHLTTDWRVIITLIGYWGVLSGAGCLLSGDFIKLFKPMIDSNNVVYRVSGFVWALLGVFLLLQTM